MDLKKINDSKRVSDSDEGQQFLAKLIFQGKAKNPSNGKEYKLQHKGGVTTVQGDDEEFKVESELFEDNIKSLAQHFNVKLG